MIYWTKIMAKLLNTIIFLFIVSYSFGQTLEEKMQQQSVQNKFKEQSNLNTTDDAWDKTFNNLGHPLSIIGGVLTLGGAGLYVAGSEGKNNHNYQPNNGIQYAGIGVFVAGAVLFAIFSTERDFAPKRKKGKKKYDKSDWDAPQ